MKEFKELLVSHLPGLMRYAVAIVGNYDRAELLVQKCIETALGKNHFWDSEKKFKPWLHTIFHHIFVSQNKSDNSPTEDNSDPEELLSLFVPSELDDFEFQDLVTCVSQLSPEEREVLLLVTLEDMPYKQISEVIGGPMGTVMTRLHQARKNFRNFRNQLKAQSEQQTEPAL